MKKFIKLLPVFVFALPVLSGCAKKIKIPKNASSISSESFLELYSDELKNLPFYGDEDTVLPSIVGSMEYESSSKTVIKYNNKKVGTESEKKTTDASFKYDCHNYIYNGKSKEKNVSKIDHNGYYDKDVEIEKLEVSYEKTYFNNHETVAFFDHVDMTCSDMYDGEDTDDVDLVEDAQMFVKGILMGEFAGFSVLTGYVSSNKKTLYKKLNKKYYMTLNTVDDYKCQLNADSYLYRGTVKEDITLMMSFETGNWVCEAYGKSVYDYNYEEDDEYYNKGENIHTEETAYIKGSIKYKDVKLKNTKSGKYTFVEE